MHHTKREETEDKWEMSVMHHFHCVLSKKGMASSASMDSASASCQAISSQAARAALVESSPQMTVWESIERKQNYSTTDPREALIPEAVGCGTFLSFFGRSHAVGFISQASSISEPL